MPDPNKQRYEHPRNDRPRRPEQRAERETVQVIAGTIPLRTLSQSGDVDYPAIRHVKHGRFQNYCFGMFRVPGGGAADQPGKFIPLPGLPLENAEVFLKLAAGLLGFDVVPKKS